MTIKLITSKNSIIPIIISLSFMGSAQADTDNCMVGKWKPEAGQLNKLFSQASKQQIKKVSGNVVLNLAKNGSGIYQMNNFTLSMNPAAGGPPMNITMTMNGKSNFNWTTANRQFSMKNYKLAIKASASMVMNGMKMNLPSLPINNRQASSGFSDGGYSCSGNKLIFKPHDKNSILTVWHRI